MTAFAYDFKKAGIKNAKEGDKPLLTFVIREINGRDEEMAANLAKSKGGAASTNEEMIRLSIVKVNGREVTQPYGGFDSWNSRARMLAMRAFHAVNGLNEKETDDFLATAEEDNGTPLSSSGAIESAIG